MKKYLLLAGFVVSTFVFSQIGINTASPKSTLDVSVSRNTSGTILDNTQHIGLKPPHLSRAELGLNTNYTADQTGALVFITDVSAGNTVGQLIKVNAVGYYYFDGNIWQKFNNLSTNETAYITGDIKNSLQPGDHDDWYLLNGRSVATLSANARIQAVALGYTVNLPDATDRMLKTKSGVETITATGGGAIVIARGNLPAVSLPASVSGTATSSSGSHTHTASNGRNFWLGGSLLGSNGQSYYTGNGTPNAFQGIGFGALTTAGNHSHTISGNFTVATGGSGTALDNKQPYVIVNTFIYLGND